MTRARGVAALSIAIAFAALAGCDSPPPSWDWERMIDQYRSKPYAATNLFQDYRAMRMPVPGTVARDEIVGNPLVTAGLDHGAYATAIPIPVDLALVQHGKTQFGIFCAPCHGVRGDGRSVVADRMDLRRPPSLISEAARALPPGRIFQVATEGYGLMKSYASDLDVADRWAVVAYVEALQRSQGGVPLDSLPPDVRARAEEELR
jgi:mono/diheme cytochrome c family protein